jgi:hypothetical protein
MEDKKSGSKMNINFDQLSKMDEDRKQLVERLRKTKPNTFGYDELCTTIRAHDDQVMQIMGIDINELVREVTVNKH